MILVKSCDITLTQHSDCVQTYKSAKKTSTKDDRVEEDPNVVTSERRGILTLPRSAFLKRFVFDMHSSPPSRSDQAQLMLRVISDPED